MGRRARRRGAAAAPEAPESAYVSPDGEMDKVDGASRLLDEMGVRR